MAPPPLTPFQHVLINVFQVDSTTHPIAQAFQCGYILTIDDLLGIKKEDFAMMTFTDMVTSQTRPLHVAAVNMILAAIEWFKTTTSRNDADFYRLTPTILSAFRRAVTAPAVVAPTTPMTPSTPTTYAGGYVSSSAAANFRKGIKLDASAFPILKEARQWNTWYRLFVATAKSQGVANVLDADYSPADADEAELFELQQNHMFAVMNRSFQEPQAIEMIRKYTGKAAGTDSGNAQLLFADVIATIRTGANARTARAALQAQLIALRLDQSWSKGGMAFILHFGNKLQDLKDMLDDTDSSYNDSWCKSTLITCLSTNNAFTTHAITLETTRSSLEETVAAMGQTIPPQTFSSFLEQVKSFAITHDATKKTANVRRQTNQSDQASQGRGNGRGRSGRGTPGRGRSGGRGNGGRGRVNRTPYSPGCDVTDPNIDLPDDVFYNLPASQQQARSARRRALHRPTGQPAVATAQRQANVAGSAPAPAPPVPSVVHPGPPSVVSAVNDSVAPGSVVRHLVSTSHSRTQNSDTVSIDGVNYRRINATQTYHVHPTSINQHPSSLIDGGANGGLLST